jgi:uncharacterized BrkB/YihY/UPF0761 family membrane protein
MSKIVQYFGMVMVLLFTTIGFMCFFTNAMDSVVPGKMKYLLGAVMIAYAFLRSIRIRRALKELQNPGK